LIDEILAHLSPANHQLAIELASLPVEIRGFGHVKQANLTQVKAREKVLLARFRSEPLRALAAE
jgi:indolepyruvate ferredoxin oxidoreductase